MKLSKPLLISVFFTGGTIVGAAASWALTPFLRTAHTTSTASAPSLTSTESIQLDQPSNQQLGQLPNNPFSSSTNVSNNTVQSTVSTNISSTFTLQEQKAHKWLEVGDRSSYRQQLQALNHIASASEDELIEIINAVERDTHRAYEKAWVYRAAIQRWSELNSQAVVLHLEELMSGGVMQSMNHPYELMRALAMTNYDAMSQWLDNLDPKQNKHIINQAYSVLAESNPKAALEQIMQNTSNSNIQQQSIEQVVMHWSNQDPIAAMEWMDQNPDWVKSSHTKEMAIMNIMHADPQAGLAMIETITNTQSRMNMQAEYASQLANSSPEEAYSWASNLSNSSARSYAQQRVLEVWSYSSPDTAINFVSSLPDGEISESALHSLYSSAAAIKGMADPASAMSWVDTLPDLFAQTARQTVFHTWVEQSPEDALQWVEYSSDPQVRDSLVQSIAPMISHSDLDLALRLYPEMSPDAQSQMAYGITQQLYYNDPSSAESWVSTLPQGPASVEATSMLVMLMSESQPLQALEMAIQQPSEVRTELLMQLTYSVSSQQSALFQNWVATADLTAEEHQMISEATRQMNADDPVQFQSTRPFMIDENFQQIYRH